LAAIKLLFYFLKIIIPAIISTTPINLLHSRLILSVPNNPIASIRQETTSCANRINIVAYAGPKSDMLLMTVNVINAPITPPSKYSLLSTSKTDSKSSLPVMNHKAMHATKADKCTQLLVAHIFDESITRVLKTPWTLIKSPASRANKIPIKHYHQFIIITLISLSTKRTVPLVQPKEPSPWLPLAAPGSYSLPGNCFYTQHNRHNLGANPKLIIAGTCNIIDVLEKFAQGFGKVSHN
jgi:hypothetical protein